jgi:hypothetical protein
MSQHIESHAIEYSYIISQQQITSHSTTPLQIRTYHTTLPHHTESQCNRSHQRRPYIITTSQHIGILYRSEPWRMTYQYIAPDHDVVSHHTKQHNTTSHHIARQHITSHNNLSHLITSPHFASQSLTSHYIESHYFHVILVSSHHTRPHCKASYYIMHIVSPHHVRTTSHSPFTEHHNTLSHIIPN